MSEIRKTRKRYGVYSDERQQSTKLYHLVQEDFPGLSFEGSKGGKLRLDQNDGGKLPNANLNMGHNNGIDADMVDGRHADELGGGGGAPTDAKYIVSEEHTTLTKEIVVPSFAAHPDTPPEISDSMDDEFNGTTLDPKWSTLNLVNIVSRDVNTTFKSHYYAVHRDEPEYTDFYSGIYQPLSGDFNIRAKVSIGGKYANYLNGGLAIAENNKDNVGKIAIIQLTRAETPGIHVDYYNSPTSWNSKKVAISNASNYAYLRIVKTNSKVSFYYSMDGLTWIEIYSETFSFFIIGFGGIFVCNNNTGQYLYVTCDWFRKVV